MKKYQRFVLSIVVATAAIFLSQCSSFESSIEGPDPSVNPITRTLSAPVSCEALAANLKVKFLAQMHARLDTYFECYSYGYDDVQVSSEAASDSSETSSVDFTSTNLQEANVDEGDIVKTDGTYLYVVSGESVDVFKAWPREEFAKLDSVVLDYSVSEIYLTDSHVVALGCNYDDSQQFTRISFINVTNPASPSVDFVKDVQGCSEKSRLVGDVLHVAISTSFSVPISYPQYSEYGEDRWTACSDEPGAAAAQDRLDEILAETIAENEAIINAMTTSDFLPQHGGATAHEGIDCSQMLLDQTEGDGLIGLLSVDVEAPESEKLTFISGSVDQVYVSTNSFYLTGTESAEDESGNWIEQTDIHRFAISGTKDKHEYFGSGAVAGTVNNSFSMSEYEGVFRIATTESNNSWGSDSTSSNNVFTLNAEDAQLPLLGQINNMAPGESIYAVRFIGNTGYVVTFETFDPLFTLDLSNPSKPVVKGELEMPGYSTYLHPLGEDYLIGFGEYTQDLSGGMLEHDGLKLATFDISNLASPSIVDEERIGSGWTLSAAFSNHLAFNFDADTGTLALPVELYDNTSVTSSWAGEFQYYGVHVYSLTSNGQISPVAEVALPDGSCPVERTVMMHEGDQSVLYVVSGNAVSLFDMNDEYQFIQSEELSSEGCASYWGGDVVIAM